MSALLRGLCCVAAADAFKATSYGPGGGGEIVEVGVDSVWVQFDEAAEPCDDAAPAVCVGDLCSDAPARASGTRCSFELPAALDAFETAYDVVVGAGGCCDENGTRSPEVRWTVTTVEEPALEDDAKTANSSVVVNRVEVFGLGLFLNDVASIDLSAGTFYGDVDVFVLKYYRPFLDAGTALKEATVETARGRACASFNSEEEAKWVFLDGGDAPDLQYINGGKFPKVETFYRGAGEEDLDHFRVRNEFYFEPTLADYPFQTQVLPLTVELKSDVLSPKPSQLLCLLEAYSGFAPTMSSFSSTEVAAKTLKATARVDEAPRRPPFSVGCENQLDFPKPRESRCPPTHATSRLSLRVEYVAPRRLGAMVLLPPALIALGSLVSYALDSPSHRLQTCATSTLAAVVQHAAIRAALPPRSVVTTADDFAFCVYAVIATALFSTLGAMLHPSSRGDLGALGLGSVLFFLHAKEPAGYGLDWATTLAAVATAAGGLFFARRLLLVASSSKRRRDDAGDYAALGTPTRNPLPLRERLLSESDELDFNASQRHDLEMVSKRPPREADGDDAGDDAGDAADVFL